MFRNIKHIEELRDSRLIMNRNMPAFGYGIILVIMCLMICAVLWAIKTPKIFVIKTKGTVSSSNSNYVMPAFSGTIANSTMFEGLIVNEGDELFNIFSSDIAIQTKQLSENRDIYIKQIEQCKKLIASIKDDTNYFDASIKDDEYYYSSYETYKAQIEQSSVDTSMYKAYGYSDEQIEMELEKNSAKISELYYSAIQAAEIKRIEAEAQLNSIDAQLIALKTGEGAYTVSATSSGRLHLWADYREGMVVQAGTIVAEITAVNDKIEIEALITPEERARIHESDSVEIEVGGLMQSVYGNIIGTVSQIDANANMIETSDGTQSMFKIIIEPQTTFVVSSSGEKIDLLNGMSVEARIQYKEVSYMQYILQKIGYKA